MITPKIIALASELINKKSITPDDQGCQIILGDLLKQAGFKLTPLNFDDTHNLWATHVGTPTKPEPVLCLAGHTDVVPAGDLTAWTHPPFQAVVENNVLWGRGASDMKASLAVQVLAAVDFVKRHPNHKGTVAFLITSDEEGTAKNGTKKALAHLLEENPDLKINYALIGEPSSINHLGDTIKIGRRGSLSGILTVQGVQGHVAYPHRASNPFHSVANALGALVKHEFDQGNADFPPTSLQFTDIDFGLGADNVIPGIFTAKFNLRFSPVQTHETIQAVFTDVFAQHDLTEKQYRIDWRLSGQPFYTKSDSKLIAAVKAGIQTVTGLTPELSTSGGTSDGRFFALYGADVVELGPTNETIHKINERVHIDELTKLYEIYQHIFEQLL